MFYGSMRHTSTGRKKKTNYWTTPKKKEPEFKPYVPSQKFVRSTPDYPSVSLSEQGKSYETKTPTKQEKIDISSNYTIAPAYNKGAYQVIGRNNIKDIGK